MIIDYDFEVLDSNGDPITGLAPVWVVLRRSRVGTSVASPNSVAPIAEIGDGFYRAEYDADGALGELIGRIDCDPTNAHSLGTLRYQSKHLTRDSSRIATNRITISSGGGSCCESDPIRDAGTKQDYIINPGQSWRKTFQWTDAAGDPLPGMDNDTFELVLIAPDGTESAGNAVELDLANAKITLDVSTTQTAAMASGGWHYRVERTQPGSILTFPFYGEFLIEVPL